MYTQFPSKDQELVGKQCLGTGDRTGRATVTSMAKACRSRSPPATAAQSSLTTLSQPAGPLDRHTVVPNSNLLPPLAKISFYVYAEFSVIFFFLFT